MPAAAMMASCVWRSAASVAYQQGVDQRMRTQRLVAVLYQYQRDVLAVCGLLFQLVGAGFEIRVRAVLPSGRLVSQCCGHRGCHQRGASDAHLCSCGPG